MSDHQSGVTPAGVHLFRTDHHEGSERDASELSAQELGFLKAASNRFYRQVSGVCTLGGTGWIAAYFIAIFTGSPLPAILSFTLGTLVAGAGSLLLFRRYQKDIAYINIENTDALQSHYTLDVRRQKKLESGDAQK